MPPKRQGVTAEAAKGAANLATGATRATVDAVKKD
jgi:hypothetical protein